MDRRIAIVTALSRSALAIIGAFAKPRWATTHEPSNVYVVNLLTECLTYRRQIGKHVAWRLDGRSGLAPVVTDLTFGQAVAGIIALHRPADIAEAARALLQQTLLLGKDFVRLDADDPWMPNPRDWERAVAEWEQRAETWRNLEDAYRDREIDLA